MRLLNPFSTNVWPRAIPARSATFAGSLLVAGALALTLLPRHGYACTTPPERYGDLLGGLREVQPAPPAPRNPAFLWSGPENSRPPADPVAVAYDPEARAQIMARVEKRIAKMTFFAPRPS